MDTLKGKNALVTGSSSGIGKAIALLFAKEGANVIVTYHSGKERADEVVKEISQYGVKTKAYGVDVAAEADVKKLFAMVDEEFGDLNILVNNAGINGSGIPVEDMSTEIWDRVIKTNLYGPFSVAGNICNIRRSIKPIRGAVLLM